MLQKYCAFLIFQNGDCPPSCICKFNLVSERPICISITNFIKIGQSVFEISWFFPFSRWWPFALLHLIGAYLDHPWRVLDGLYHCLVTVDAVVVLNNKKFEYLAHFGLKMPIHAQNRSFGDSWSLNGQQYQWNPKRHTFCASPRRLSHQTQKSADLSDL